VSSRWCLSSSCGCGASSEHRRHTLPGPGPIRSRAWGASQAAPSGPGMAQAEQQAMRTASYSPRPIWM
jgi:hypothetical protein